MNKPALRAKLHTTPFPLVFSNGVRLRVESRVLQTRGSYGALTGVDTSTVVTFVCLDGTHARILHFEGPDAALDSEDLKASTAVFEALGLGSGPVASFAASVNQTRADAFADPVDA